MISIVCSSQHDLSEFRDNLLKNCGLKDVEFLGYINNGEYSLTEIYQKGLEESKYDIVMFTHNDISITNGLWGKKLLKHFKDSDFGILGFAGTKHLTRNAVWWEDNSSCYGQVTHNDKDKPYLTTFSKNYGPKIIETIVLDGLCFFVNKNKLKAEFDTNIKKFHYYDLDFTFNNHINGCKVGVIFNIRITHDSIGRLNDDWKINKKKFVRKFSNFLPRKIL